MDALEWWRANLASKQRGMSMLAMAALAGLVAFLGLFLVKIGPHFAENMTVSSIAENTANDAELMKKPKSQVYASISTAYRMNSLWDLKPQDTITLKKDGKRGYVVTVDYEKRVTLFGNIDVVTKFEKVAGNPS